MKVWEHLRPALAASALCFVASPVWAICPDLVVLGHIAQRAEALSNSRETDARRYHARVLALDLGHVDAPLVTAMLADEYEYGREDWVTYTLTQLEGLAAAGDTDNPVAIQSFLSDTEVYIGLNRFRIAGGMPDCPSLSDDVPLVADDTPPEDDNRNAVAPDLNLGDATQHARDIERPSRDLFGWPLMIGGAVALILALSAIGWVIARRYRQRREPRLLCDTDCEVRVSDAGAAPADASALDMEFTRILNINRFGACLRQPHTPIHSGHVDIRCRGDIFGATVRWSNDRSFGVQLDNELSDAEVAKIVNPEPETETEAA